MILGKVFTDGCFFGGGVGSISCFDLDFVVEYFALDEEDGDGGCVGLQFVLFTDQVGCCSMIQICL